MGKCLSVQRIVTFIICILTGFIVLYILIVVIFTTEAPFRVYATVSRLMEKLFFYEFD